MPNSIAHTGIRPFVAISFLALITETFAAFLFLIILQKAIALRANGFMYYQLKPVDDKLDENQEDLYDDSKINFHLISEMFLPIYLQVGFDLLCLVLFGVSEITNGLSGSQIFAVALHSRAVLPGFIWIGASLLIFMRRFLNRFIPVLSLIPLVILIVTVVCCLVVGNAIHNPIHSSWEYGASPLLIVLASLGGTARLMPYLVNFIQFERKSLIYFYLSIILAQITTTVLNILWCYAVLSVVPQTCNEIPSSFLNESFTTGDQHCNLTLLWARDNGIIATTPLSLILYQNYPQFRWAAVLVVLFVFMTTIISYLTAGLPLMTLITGINESFWKKYTSLVQKTQEQSDEDLLTNSAAERQRVWMCLACCSNAKNGISLKTAHVLISVPVI
ncbi:uncharacterized protein TRIADDRAFT_58684 [Trichoplax adhaerens]|uniref:Uncharacterized protein n=1 Tax=Trichoplax adhaerens TaxID=10228 RepID=B3S3E0_TRIAD|nr:hypothetical protein TRIADDRAFT_58684 [Trichoplax adhaerens]EDV22774.1 hypothetical protein TRIADDRAFT_58684 [Trichoplax adhaerens]|eukprot:XP_002114640.1 hypothetical protein TRIADDRAFT_58684 [Trichoplax adhaerens]